MSDLTINDLRVARDDAADFPGIAVRPLTPAEFAHIARDLGYIKRDVDFDEGALDGVARNLGYVKMEGIDPDALAEDIGDARYYFKKGTSMFLSEHSRIWQAAVAVLAALDHQEHHT